MTRIQKARDLQIANPPPPRRKTVEYKGEELLANVSQADFDYRMGKGCFGGDPLKCALTPMGATRKGNREFVPWVGPEENRR